MPGRRPSPAAGDASAPSNAVVPYGNPGTAGPQRQQWSAGQPKCVLLVELPRRGHGHRRAFRSASTAAAGADKAGNGSASFDTGGYSTDATIEARAVNSVGHVRAGADRDGRGAVPRRRRRRQSPPSLDCRGIAPYRSCTGISAWPGSDHYRHGNRPRCTSQWLPDQHARGKSTAGGTAGHSGAQWYHITTPAATGAYSCSQGQHSAPLEHGGRDPGCDACPAGAANAGPRPLMASNTN